MKINELEEAKKLILNFMDHLKYMRRKISCTDLDGIYDTCLTALEAQVPKEPIVCEGIGEYICPVCDETVGNDCIDGIYKKAYCESCGQRIDWEGYE